eukprot:tig00000970_g5853.t1
MIHASQFTGKPKNMYRAGVLIGNWNEDKAGDILDQNAQKSPPPKMLNQSVSHLVHQYRGPAAPPDLKRDMEGEKRDMLISHGLNLRQAYFNTLNELTMSGPGPKLRPQQALGVVEVPYQRLEQTVAVQQRAAAQKTEDRYLTTTKATFTRPERPSAAAAASPAQAAP